MIFVGQGKLLTKIINQSISTKINQGMFFQSLPWLVIETVLKHVTQNYLFIGL